MAPAGEMSISVAWEFLRIYFTGGGTIFTSSGRISCDRNVARQALRVLKDGAGPSTKNRVCAGYLGRIVEGEIKDGHGFTLARLGTLGKEAWKREAERELEELKSQRAASLERGSRAVERLAAREQELQSLQGQLDDRKAEEEQRLAAKDAELAAQAAELQELRLRGQEKEAEAEQRLAAKVAELLDAERRAAAAAAGLQELQVSSEQRELQARERLAAQEARLEELQAQHAASRERGLRAEERLMVKDSELRSLREQLTVREVEEEQRLAARDLALQEQQELRAKCEAELEAVGAELEAKGAELQEAERQAAAAAAELRQLQGRLEHVARGAELREQAEERRAAEQATRLRELQAQHELHAAGAEQRLAAKDAEIQGLQAQLAERMAGEEQRLAAAGQGAEQRAKLEGRLAAAKKELEARSAQLQRTRSCLAAKDQELLQRATRIGVLQSEVTGLQVQVGGLKESLLALGAAPMAPVPPLPPMPALETLGSSALPSHCGDTEPWHAFVPLSHAASQAASQAPVFSSAPSSNCADVGPREAAGPGQVLQEPAAVEGSLLMLTLSKHPWPLHKALLACDLAQELRATGAELQPAWAQGATVLLRGDAEAAVRRTDLVLAELCSHHVLVAAGEDEERLGAALQAVLPCRHRAKVRGRVELQQQVHAQQTSNCEDAELREALVMASQASSRASCPVASPAASQTASLASSRLVLKNTFYEVEEAGSLHSACTRRTA